MRAANPSVGAIPLGLKAARLGCLNLSMTEPAPLSDTVVACAQALADVVSIAVVHDPPERLGPSTAARA